MKLYYARGSSSLLPHIVLLEAGLPFTTVEVDEHSKVIEGGGDYRRVNPLGYVPALVLDDETLLTEGPAIVQYIADQAPTKNLAPPNGTIERTKLQSWLNFLSSEIHKGGFSPLFYKVCQKRRERSSALASSHDLPTSMTISEATNFSWVIIIRSPMRISSSSRIGRPG